MINKEKILQTAQSLVRQYNLPLKLLGVEELPEAFAIYFTSEKRIRLRELEQELEIQLNLPIKLERIKKSETGKIGEIDVLGKYPCCAPFLRKCPFGGKTGCGYGLGGGKTEYREQRTEIRRQKTEDRKPAEPAKTPKERKKKKKKMVRRLVLKR